MSNSGHESVDIESLKQLIRARLNESGWTGNLQAYCQNLAEQQESLPTKDLIKQAEEYGRNLLDSDLRKEIREEVRNRINEKRE